MPETRYRIADLNFDITSSSASLLEAAEAALEHFGAVHAEEREARFHLDLEAAQPDRRVPEPPPEALRLDTGHQAWQRGGEVVLKGEGLWSELIAARGRGRVFVPEGTEQRPGGLQAALFGQIALSLIVLFRRQGQYALHGSALVRGRDALLCIADSDSGKSTLAFSLVRQGWHYLTDDTLLVRTAPSSGEGHGEPAVEAVGFRVRFGLDLEAIDHFAELDARMDRQVAEPDKLSVPVEALYAGRRAAVARPRVLLFPQIVEEAQSRLIPASRLEALDRLMRQTALLMLDAGVAQQHLETLKRLVNQTRHYHLRAGRDVLERPARVSRLLAETLRTAC